jgi:hypothetical protein
MPRITPPALLLPAVAALVLSGGCTTAVPGTASAESAAAAQGTGDATAWVDQVCGSLLPFMRAASTPPQPGAASNPTALVQNISDYLSEIENSVGTAISGMAAAGPAPVAGGDEIVEGLTSTLETMQTTLRDARTRIEGVDVNDRQALLREVPAAVASLEQLATMQSPLADLQRSPELTRAGQDAANCQQIAREFGR